MILIYPKRVVPQFVTRSNTLSHVLPVSNNSTFNSVSSPFFGPRLNCPGEDDCMSEIEGFEPGNRDYVRPIHICCMYTSTELHMFMFTLFYQLTRAYTLTHTFMPHGRTRAVCHVHVYV